MAAPLGPHGPVLLGGPGRAAVRDPGSAVPPDATRHGSATPDADARFHASAGHRLGGPLAVAVAAAAGFVALGLTDPYRPGGHPVCPVLALTGFYCAGCGAQRAVHDLAHLDLAAAWGMNPLVVIAVPLAVVLWARWLRRRWALAPDRVAPRARPHAAPGVRPWPPSVQPCPARTTATTATLPRPLEARPATAWAVLTVVVAFAVLRNVPLLQPWLAP